MGIFQDIAFLVIGLVMLYFGAEWLVNGAAKIAVRTGLSPLVVGLTIVAFGTSAPELFVSISLNFSGSANMSIGNVVGSNICNIALVLGISAFICALHVKSELLIRDLPFLVIASLVFVWMMLADGVISQLEGIILFLGVVGFTLFQLRISRKVKNPDVVKEFEEEFGTAEEVKDSAWKLAGLVIVGLVVLYFGSEFLKNGGTGIARRFGVPEAIIGLTVLAFATSVPELATSAVAAMKKEGDIIVGNVIGSCIFNLLCVIGITAGLKPMIVTQINNVDLILMVALAVVLIPIMLTRRRVSRVEGTALLLTYTGYCVYLWFGRIAPAIDKAT